MDTREKLSILEKLRENAWERLRHAESMTSNDVAHLTTVLDSIHRIETLLRVSLVS
jgi:hypothetical protein